MNETAVSDTLHFKGYKARERGDFLLALNYYTQAHQLNVGDPNLLLGQAFCLVLLKRYEEATVLYKEVVNRQPTSWRAHSGLGASYLRLRRYEEAVTALKHAIELQVTGDVDSYVDLAYAYSALQQHDDAADVVETATRLGLSHPRLDLQRGYIAVSRGDMDRALGHFRRAEAGAPGETDITYTVATAAQQLKKFLIARDAFKRVLVTRPDRQDALFGLARSEFALSNPLEAFAALEKAYADDPEKLQAVLKDKQRMLGPTERPKGAWSMKWRKPSPP